MWPQLREARSPQNGRGTEKRQAFLAEALPFRVLAVWVFGYLDDWLTGHNKAGHGKASYSKAGYSRIRYSRNCQSSRKANSPAGDNHNADANPMMQTENYLVSRARNFALINNPCRRMVSF